MTATSAAQLIYKADRSGLNPDHPLVETIYAFIDEKLGPLLAGLETKRGRDRAGSRGQAVSNAVWAKEKFGERWVTAILCVGTDPPPLPAKQGYVWVVGVTDLVPLLRRGNL